MKWNIFENMFDQFDGYLQEYYKLQNEDKMIKLEWKPLTETAKAPQKAHTEDAAYDLFADSPDAEIMLNSGETRIVSTGVAIMPPAGWSCDIRGRSGMNSKGKLVILGLVDSFYTGAWGIVMHNSTNHPIYIKHHDKIAQFTVNRIYDSVLEKVEAFTVPTNARGASGFGSTGVK
jgi:dUTP pyrophosphatase